MYRTVEDQERWIRLGQRLLSLAGPVEPAPSAMKEILRRIAPLPRPRTFHFGRHSRPVQ